MNKNILIRGHAVTANEQGSIVSVPRGSLVITYNPQSCPGSGEPLEGEYCPFCRIELEKLGTREGELIPQHDSLFVGWIAGDDGYVTGQAFTIVDQAVLSLMERLTNSDEKWIAKVLKDIHDEVR